MKLALFYHMLFTSPAKLAAAPDTMVGHKLCTNVAVKGQRPQCCSKEGPKFQ